MFKIKTLNNIAPVWQDVLAADAYTVSADAENEDAIIVRSADMHGMELPDSLLCVARAGAGVNNIPTEELAEKGIVVFNTPGANANAVKELTIAGLLLAGRDLFGGMNWVQGLKGQGDAVGKLVEKGKSQFVGPELQGKTLGVIGLGGIGVQVANTAVALGMKVLGYDPFISVENAWRLSRAVTHSIDEKALVAESDYISVHVPLSDKTRGSINAELFSAMKEGTVLLNFARGEIVDTDALLQALESGKVRRYVTDFPNDRLLGRPDVIALPHLGASTPESENNCVEMAASEIDAFLRTGTITHSVNYPDCTLPAAFNYRLIVMHANVPNTVSRITAAVAAKGINIESMVNASRGKMAYTALDMNEALDAESVARLNTMEGVYRARLISA